MNHPMQPIEVAQDGIIRFKVNKIVEFLQETHKNNLCDLRAMNFSQDDWTQFCQLIGYSVCGFCDLSFVDETIKDRAWEDAKLLMSGPIDEEDKNDLQSPRRT